VNDIDKSKEYRKLLIKHRTSFEKRFITLLKTLGINNYVFQKEWIQEGGFYISDFYFPEIKLTIELDGKQHQEEDQKKRDKKKAIWLKSQGISTTRIENSKVRWMSTNDVKKLLVKKGLFKAKKEV